MEFKFKFKCILALAVLSIVSNQHTSADVSITSEFERLFFRLFPEVVKGSPRERLALIDWYLQDVVPLLVGQPGNNEYGTKWQFKEYAMLDESNDDAVRLSGQALITRSGFQFESYDALADDGYITVITRIINPLADPKKLRQPPVLMEHGGTIDSTSYLVASSIQHHPEKWPKTIQDGPMTSWNRSLAFVLANNGFDVWLAETRGANEKNKRHKVFRSLETAGLNKDKNMTIGETIDELARQWAYESFSLDDIIAHELKSHIDLVLRKTGADKVHLLTFSLSTPTALGFLSIRPDYAERVEGFVVMAPVISSQGTNAVLKVVLEGICPHIPDHIGVVHITDIVLSQPFRELLILLSRSKLLRYSLIKAITTLLAGPSPKYGTNLELNLLGHLLRHLSFRLLKQMCQQLRYDRLQKYDYGPVKNKLLYNSEIPPLYDLSNLKLNEWIVVSGGNDKLATLEVVDHLVKIVNPKPVATIIAPEFNHLDLIANFENDLYVNMPILRYYQEMSNKYEHGHDLQAAGARNLDLRSFLPPDFKPEKLTETAGNITKSLASLKLPPLNLTLPPLNLTSILTAADANFAPLSKSFFDFITNLSSRVLGQNDTRLRPPGSSTDH